LIGEALVISGAVHNVLAAVGVAASATLLSATTATIALRPGLRDIAATVDARLDLQDRLVTALQFNTSADPFSQLVVRDAYSRVTAVRAADAVPFALPRGIRFAAASAATVLAVMILATTEVPRWSLAGWTGIGGLGLTTDAADAAARATSAAKQQVNSAAASSIAADHHATDRSSARQQTAAAETGATTQSAQARSQRELASVSSDRIQRLERGSTTRGGSTNTNTAGNTPNDAGIAGGAASTSYEQRGGGVANGVRSARSTDTAPPADSTYRAAYRNGRAAAESAVAQDRVPADLRSYVRDYFIAIRPTGDK
jgi:hypothetical protein